MYGMHVAFSTANPRACCVLQSMSQGDDLYIERTISLSEALCGFTMELKHLDGRTLIIKSKPGDVIKPVSFDPFREEDESSLWDLYEDCDTPSLENAAVAETEDIKICKKVCISSPSMVGQGIVGDVRICLSFRLCFVNAIVACMLDDRPSRRASSRARASVVSCSVVARPCLSSAATTKR